jgi:indole-3-glycerol phosphate synthase
MRYKEVLMHRRMNEILGHKRREVENLRKKGLCISGENDLSPIRDFKTAISLPGRISLIAEIKFASPSAGVICEKMDPCAIGKIYEDAGAVAVSLLTDSRFFGGNLDDLRRLKKAVSLPILRKDFIIDEIQVRESFLYGADAVLLIARILLREQLKALIVLSKELRLAPLIEIHDRHDLEKAVDCGAEIIGINNRNLETFEVCLQTTLDLVPLVPKKCVIVSESGIFDKEHIQSLGKSGIQAVLVGTSIMESHDIASKTRELVDAGTQTEEPYGRN